MIEAPPEGLDRSKHLTAVAARQLDQVVGGVLEARSLPGKRRGRVLVAHESHCSAANAPQGGAQDVESLTPLGACPPAPHRRTRTKPPEACELQDSSGSPHHRRRHWRRGG